MRGGTKGETGIEHLHTAQPMPSGSVVFAHFPVIQAEQMH